MAKLFQEMTNSRARCLLCPRYCELRNNQTGICNGRINTDGEIVPSNFGVVSAVAVEPIEKKPFKRYLPGTKTLSVGGFGCNLECKYCENENISQVGAGPNSKHFTPQQLIEVAIEKHCESICLTYNEPTIAFEYLIRIGELCHEDGLELIIKTNAYINEEPWEEVCKVVDAMNIDYKGFGNYFEDATQCRYKDYSQKIWTAINNDVHVELSIPIMPGYSNDDHRYFWPLEIGLAEVNKNVPCHLLKINPAHLMIDSPTTSDEDIALAKEHLKYIFDEKYIYV